MTSSSRPLDGVQESHVYNHVGGFHKALEDVARLSMLPVFGDKNAMGVVLLEWEDEVKAYLVSAMTT